MDAFTAPKKTMVSAGAAPPRPEQLMVTFVPILPDAGVKELMTGWASIGRAINKSAMAKRLKFLKKT